MSHVHLSLQDAHDLAFNCLRDAGADDNNANAAAARMVQAEADKCYSHGLFRLAWYVKGVKSGRVNGTARPRINQLAPAVLQVNGDGGFAPYGQEIAHRPLVACARQQGIAALAFTNMFHIAAMWPEVEKLARDGLVAISVTASYPYVAPAGGSRPVFGTNPMGFAWPRGEKDPLVFDQASSSTARGEIMIAARDGHTVPETAGVGPNGETTTDPNVVLQGAQLGFGGYKGASLAMMIELLAGPLIGDFLSIEAKSDDGGNGGPPKGGELIIAMDPAMFGDADGFLAHGEKLFESIAEQDGTRLPGERRFANRAATKTDGIQVPQALWDEISALRD